MLRRENAKAMIVAPDWPTGSPLILRVTSTNRLANVGRSE
jgi:hypothetical protein